MAGAIPYLNALGRSQETISGALPNPPTMSLSRFVDDAREGEKTLTVFTDDDEELFEELREFFGVQNVRVRHGHVEGTGPAEFVVLHQGEDAVAVSTLSAVRSALFVDEDADFRPGDGDDAETPDVVRSLGNTTFTVDGDDELLLTRIANHVDELAYRTGEGTLHSGIRRVSALVEDAATMSRYRRLAEAGVETHVYGEFDADPPAVPRVSVHPEDADEVAETRFEVFDGPDAASKAALVAVERGRDSYRGFWTFEADIVEDLAAYLADTYLGD